MRRSLARMSYSALFKGKSHSSGYATFRPTYPQDLYDLIGECLPTVADGKEPVTPQLAVDIACGTGQCTVQLVKPPISASRVLGLDVSQTQISSATPDEKVSYACGDATDLAAVLTEQKLATPSLLTVAQGFHWFEPAVALQSWYDVLTSQSSGAENARLAIWGYGMQQTGNSEVDELINFHLYETILGEYWSDRRREIDNKYQKAETVLSSMKHKTTGKPLWTLSRYDSHPNDKTTISQLRPEIAIRRSMNVAHMVGYLRSWSAYQTYMKTHEEDPMLEIEAKLQAFYPDDNIAVETPVFLLVASPVIQ